MLSSKIEQAEITMSHFFFRIQVNFQIVAFNLDELNCLWVSCLCQYAYTIFRVIFVISKKLSLSQSKLTWVDRLLSSHIMVFCVHSFPGLVSYSLIPLGENFIRLPCCVLMIYYLIKGLLDIEVFMALNNVM